MKYKTGVTRADVVEAALALTRERGLYGWSVRDLVKVLGTANSVVYTKVGGKDALCAAVVEQIFTHGDLAPTDPELGWREWFRGTLLALRDELVRYPGVAKWLTMHGGPVFPGVLERFHVGVVKLREAGFGDAAVTVFAVLVITAMNTIMMSDERLVHEDDGPRDHVHIVDALKGLAGADPAAADFLAFSERFAGDPADADAQRREFYALVISTLLDGFEKA
jgi:AcrR family transcriptional regulator